jgi:hypothetical protein
MQINDVVRLAGGELARPALFNAFLTIPNVVNANVTTRSYDVLCKGVTVPPISNEPITMKYLGQDVPIPGRVTTTNRLQATFILDENHSIYNEISEWAKGMDNLHYNTTTFIQNIQESYISNKLGEITLTPHTWANETNISYTFKGLYPINVSGINFQSDNTSSTMEVAIEFSFLTFDITGVGTGNIIDVIEGDLFKFTYELTNGIVSDVLNTSDKSQFFGTSGFSNFTENIPQYAAQTIAKSFTSVFKF